MVISEINWPRHLTYEIFNGEEDLVEDLKLIRKTYADSLIHLFGHMSALAPIHQQFHANMSRAQCKDGFWLEIGPAVEKWIKDSSCKLLQQFDSGIQVITIYINVITFSLQAKAFLDKKTSEDKSLSDFLQRCSSTLRTLMILKQLPSLFIS